MIDLSSVPPASALREHSSRVRPPIFRAPHMGPHQIHVHHVDPHLQGLNAKRCYGALNVFTIAVVAVGIRADLSDS